MRSRRPNPRRPWSDSQFMGSGIGFVFVVGSQYMGGTGIGAGCHFMDVGAGSQYVLGTGIGTGTIAGSWYMCTFI